MQMPVFLDPVLRARVRAAQSPRRLDRRRRNGESALTVGGGRWVPGGAEIVEAWRNDDSGGARDRRERASRRPLVRPGGVGAGRALVVARGTGRRRAARRGSARWRPSCGRRRSRRATGSTTSPRCSKAGRSRQRSAADRDRGSPACGLPRRTARGSRPALTHIIGLGRGWPCACSPTRSGGSSRFYALQVRLLWDWRPGRLPLLRRALVSLLVGAVSLGITAWLLPGRHDPRRRHGARGRRAASRS